ncbi:MAG: hypothetical protein ACI8RD_012551 [Bacillariaceae sp.]|jgi:hypothetical protein
MKFTFELIGFCLVLSRHDFSFFNQSIINKVQKIPRQFWVGIGSVAIIAGSAYPVFSKDVRPGHEYFSSEKPEVILLAQEAKHKEYTQQLKERRAQLKADQEKSSNQ